jgi:chemotaxis protein histidine kinase CheA
MMERASLLKGSVQIASQPGQGTTIDMTLPLARGTLAETETETETETEAATKAALPA